MELKSTRSNRFIEWVRKAFGMESGTGDMDRIVELERTARLLVHAYDLTGEVRPEDIHALSRSVKLLQKEYEAE